MSFLLSVCRYGCPLAHLTCVFVSGCHSACLVVVLLVSGCHSCIALLVITLTIFASLSK
eukprot:m.39792 g.39792  ORF g.39792 m.39792 type:complete len:59 (+) comp45679_c0_seq1:329-505(+)